MSRYWTVEKHVEVEVDLEDFETKDLVEELERRNNSGIDWHKAGAKVVIPGYYIDPRDIVQSLAAAECPAEILAPVSEWAETVSWEHNIQAMTTPGRLEAWKAWVKSLEEVT